MTEQHIEEFLARRQQEVVFQEDTSRHIESALLESETVRAKAERLEYIHQNLTKRLEIMKKESLKDAVMIEELLKKISEFRDMAFYDDLTGLYKRKAFVKLLEGFKESGIKSGCFILLDIDKFKSINDYYSHAKGDEVLVKVSNFLSQSFRATDPIARISIKEKTEDAEKETHTVGRMGGEEIAIFVPNATPDDVVQIFKRITHSSSGTDLDGETLKLEMDLELGSSSEESTRLTNAGDISSDDVAKRINKITFSGGVLSVNLESTEDMEGLVEKALEIADKALYEAKRNGRNQILFIKPEENE